MPDNSIAHFVLSSASHQQAEGRHSFLPILAVVRVFDGSSSIGVKSPSDYDLDILVRIGPRAFLVHLKPNGTGSAGSLAVPEPLSLPAPVALLACLRPGDEQ